MRIKTALLSMILLLPVAAVAAEESSEGFASSMSAEICQTMRKFQQRYCCCHAAPGGEYSYLDWSSNGSCALMLFGRLYPPYNPADDWYADDINHSDDPLQRVASMVSELCEIWNDERIYRFYVKENYHNIDGRETRDRYLFIDWLGQK